VVQWTANYPCIALVITDPMPVFTVCRISQSIKSSHFQVCYLTAWKLLQKLILQDSSDKILLKVSERSGRRTNITVVQELLKP
jgi:hypothetical protein